jgi:hypothetical protein
LVRHLEDFGFFDLEKLQTGENRLSVQSGVVDGSGPRQVELSVFAPQLSEIPRSQKYGPYRESHRIASSFFAGINANRTGALLCGFFGAKRKLFSLSSALYSSSSDSHSNGGNPPKLFPSVSKIAVSVFAWRSQRAWNWEAPKTSRLSRYKSLKDFPFNSAKIAGKSETIRPGAVGDSERAGDEPSAGDWIGRAGAGRTFTGIGAGASGGVLEGAVIVPTFTFGAETSLRSPANSVDSHSAGICVF